MPEAKSMYLHHLSIKTKVSAAAVCIAALGTLTFALEFVRPVQARNPPGDAAPSSVVAHNICVLDRQSISQQAIINVASARRLAELSEVAQNEINAVQQSLQAEYKALDLDRTTSNNRGLIGKKAALDEGSKRFAASVDAKRKQIEATRTEVARQIAAAVQPILQSVEKTRSCSILLPRENILDRTADADITKNMLDAMNAQLRPMPFGLVKVD